MEDATIQPLQNGVGQGVEGKGSTNHDTKSSTPDSKQLDKPSLNDAFNLPIIWYTSPSGTETVNTIVTPSWIYAGSNGAVYRLDNKGNILKTQGLSGYGYHPVSLAASSDGNLLAIGTYKYVVRLAPVSLDIIWYFRTDDLGGDVSVMISPNNQRIYAGTAGAVFSLDMNGNKMGKQAITAGGNESRIALDPSGSFVALGTSGYAAVYTAPNLDQKLWSTKMDKGVGPTTVLFNGTTLYIADSGFIWVMDALHGGTPLHTADVGQEAGYKDIHLALDAANNRLYVGTNGYGGLYDATNLAKKYLYPLPGSGYSVTDVVWAGNSGLFANNARVFQLDSSGTVTARNDMDGYGNKNTSLTLLGSDRVIASPDGYVVGLLMLETP
jgi:hypothetical protein